MKHILLSLFAIISFASASAQEATTDYIYSSDGFEVKTGVMEVAYGNGSRTYECTGLYTKDGKTLISAISVNGTSATKIFYVLDGTEVICSRAFQSLSEATVYLPSTIRYIAPDAIISTSGTANRFGDIVDGCREKKDVSHISMPANNNPSATEVARYNLQGQSLATPVPGINIIQKSDGSAMKVVE